MNLITHFVRPNFSYGKTELNSNIYAHFQLASSASVNQKLSKLKLDLILPVRNYTTHNIELNPIVKFQNEIKSRLNSPKINWSGKKMGRKVAQPFRVRLTTHLFTENGKTVISTDCVQILKLAR